MIVTSPRATCHPHMDDNTQQFHVNVEQHGGRIWALVGSHISGAKGVNNNPQEPPSEICQSDRKEQSHCNTSPLEPK